MATRREIEGIYGPPVAHPVGDGFTVRGYFSVIPDAERKLSPFLLLDHNARHITPPTEHRVGVGPHPHRGFETVTLSWESSIAHHDSMGNHGVVGPGDVQWMTAASGVLHSEYREQRLAREGGPMHGAQLWVNLPKAHKMDAPRYQTLTADRMGSVALPDDGGVVRVISGEYQGVNGPAKTFTPVTVLDAHLRLNARADFSFPAHHTAALLVMRGEVTLNGGATAKASDFVVFRNEGEVISLAARSDAHVLVLSGEPIDEPIAAYGPFVMNTEREIREAMSDFQRGKFGHLEDEVPRAGEAS